MAGGSYDMSAVIWLAKLGMLALCVAVLLLLIGLPALAWWIYNHMSVTFH
jgi:hypothetical protein